VDVVFVGSWGVVIDDVGDAGDVEAAGGHVGGAKDLHMMVGEEPKGLDPLVLILVAVDGLGDVAGGAKVAGQALHAVLGLAEDEHLVEFRVAEEGAEDLELVLADRHADDVLFHLFGRVARLDRDHDRVLQEYLDQVVDFARGRGREEERMAAGRHLRQHELHVADESHVEHPVRLIEDHRGELREVYLAALHEVFQASGCADNELRRLGKPFHLQDYRSTADAGDGVKVHMGREALELALYLKGQLPGRHDDQNFLLGRQEHFVDERDKEGRGLACARIGQADQVGAAQDVRDGLVLDGGRHEISLAGDIRLQPVVYLEIRERVFGHEMGRLLGDGRLVDEFGDVDVTGETAARRAPACSAAKTAVFPARLASIVELSLWAARACVPESFLIHDCPVVGRLFFPTRPLGDYGERLL